MKGGGGERDHGCTNFQKNFTGRGASHTKTKTTNNNTNKPNNAGPKGTVGVGQKKGWPVTQTRYRQGKELLGPVARGGSSKE